MTSLRFDFVFLSAIAASALDYKLMTILGESMNGTSSHSSSSDDALVPSGAGKRIAGWGGGMVCVENTG